MQQEITNAIAALESNLNTVHAENWPTLPYTYKVSVETGKVYARIVLGEIWKDSNEETSRRVYGFIKLDDLTLWKAAGWKAPAKNKARGVLADLTNIDIIRRRWDISIS
jgi:hypothetical protein